MCTLLKMPLKINILLRDKNSNNQTKDLKAQSMCLFYFMVFRCHKAVVNNLSDFQGSPLSIRIIRRPMTFSVVFDILSKDGPFS